VATYVLIPGAGGDAWQWHRVAPELAGRGHDVVSVELPAGDDRAGWAEYGQAIEAAIGDRTDLVLVAQSLAGFSAPIVCATRPVELLVLLNAMIPRPGETGAAWWSNTRQGDAQREHLAMIGLSVEAAEDDRALYYHDVSPDVVAEAWRRGEPSQSWTPMEQPWPLAAWPDVRTRVLAGTDDRLFPASFQRRVARERLGLETDEIVGGHMVALSQPQRLAERLEALRLAPG
jgi:pimeloyl-ACP methyl ester carboxylesterase